MGYADDAEFVGIEEFEKEVKREEEKIKRKFKKSNKEMR